MTEDELRGIEARAAAATAGEWVADIPGGQIYCGSTCDLIVDDAYRSADIAFIAAARADVPALCAEAWRLRAALGKWECPGCGCLCGARHEAGCPELPDPPPPATADPGVIIKGGLT